MKRLFHTNHEQLTGFASRAGYSLVEISLALLVIAVGLLAVFALIPEGLGTARRAVDDVEMVAFAEFVFSSLTFEAADTNQAWASFGPAMRLVRSHALRGVQQEPPVGQPYIIARGDLDTAHYFWIPDWYADPNWAVESHKVASFEYSLMIGDVVGSDPMKYARLEVWAGDYRGMTPPGRGRIFYREFLPIQ